jgi:hypothetical protein
MNGIQVYLLIAPIILVAVAGAVVWFTRQDQTHLHIGK